MESWKNGGGLSLSDDEEDTMEQHVDQLQVLGTLMKFKKVIVAVIRCTTRCPGSLMFGLLLPRHLAVSRKQKWLFQRP